MHLLSLNIMEWQAVVEHRTPLVPRMALWKNPQVPSNSLRLLFCLKNETHEGLMVGLAMAQTHRRWNIYVIVEEFTPCSKVALHSWLDVCSGETLECNEQCNKYRSVHIAFHADVNSFKLVWSAEWEGVFAVMNDKEFPFFMFVWITDIRANTWIQALIKSDLLL